MAESVWTKEEIEILKDSCRHNKSINQIRKDLSGKTEAQIRSKCQKLNISFNKERKYWSRQELDAFKEDWRDATVSYAALRRKYKNRSITALRSCARRLGLAVRPHDETYLTISDIMVEMQVSKDRVRMWIRNGLKYHKSKIKPVKYLIDFDDLLLFLKEHPDFYDASKISDYLFCDEPEWLRKKRKRDMSDFRTRSKKSEYYSDQECQYIIAMFKRGKSNVEIAKELNRTEYGIERMLSILGYSRRRYNDYEIEIIKNNCQTHTLDEIVEMLPLRTRSGVIAKCEQLKIKYHTK